ncbi:MAG: DNA methyltransferase [Armatimonadota bacterium]
MSEDLRLCAPDADADAHAEAADRRRNSLNDLSGREWIKATKSWLICDSRRYHANRDYELHPARYPEELVADFLRFFTKRGGWVLDPFCGSGATLVAAVEEGRNSVGVEISRRYAQMSRERVAGMAGRRGVVAGVLCCDARELARPETWRELAGPPLGADGLPRFDFVMTSPPYWNMLRTSRGGVFSKHKQRAEQGLDTDYGDEEGNLGRLTDYHQFIEALGGIFDDCGRLLRPGRYLVIVAQNVRVPEGYVRPLAWDLAARVAHTLSFQGERIWCQNSKQLGIWGYPTTFVPNYHHHYCLIFRKDGAPEEPA